ncbi:putative transposase [Solidesulfovibrio magneticus RS-1]|uniref:Transposase n=1 Tax=Solidesulfovibrio magneticus (strain ATCC 700980 / DSM 13731 / RS-1) TaxID=573370 RepID=C4XM21_SOLM1|nr:putative transposase [Solidesulfovibrio magneticus RS-1]
MRLMRENALLAYKRPGRPHGPKAHDGTIKTQRVDEMWGTDMASKLTFEEGNAAIFSAIDHCSLEVVGIHAAKRGTRFEALEPIRQGVRHSFGAFGQDVARVADIAARPRQPLYRRGLPAGDRLSRHQGLGVLRARASGQLHCRTLCPHPQGKSSLGTQFPKR